MSNSNFTKHIEPSSTSTLDHILFAMIYHSTRTISTFSISYIFIIGLSFCVVYLPDCNNSHPKYSYLYKHSEIIKTSWHNILNKVERIVMYHVSDRVKYVQNKCTYRQGYVQRWNTWYQLVRTSLVFLLNIH